MMLPRHTYRSQSESFSEGRMTHEMPEVQHAADLLQNPAASLDELQDAINRGRNTQKQGGEFMNTLAEQLRQRDPRNIGQNLETLAMRASTEKLHALKSTIDTLRTSIGALPPSALQPENVEQAAVSTPKEQSSLLEKIGTGVGDTAETVSEAVLPKSWNEHMTRNQKIAAGAAITLGAGVVLWQLGKMLFGRGKHAAEEGKEAAANTKGGFFKKLLIGGLVGAGLFFGVRHFMGSKEDSAGNGSKKQKNSVMDFLWDKIVPEDVKPYLESAQESASATIKTAETVTPVVGGVGSHMLKRGKELVGGNAEVILDGIKELTGSQSALETAEILAVRGLSLLYVNGKWVIDNGKQAMTVPFNFYKRLAIDGDIKSYQEGAWLYGEAGAAYVLGRTTLNSILNSKLPLPSSFSKLGLMKSAGSTILQSAAHPLLFAYDSARLIPIFFTEDGRTILNGQLLRSGYIGTARELLLKFNNVDDFVRSAHYFQEQQAFLTALEKSKHVDPHVLKEIRTSVLNIADSIAKNAQKMNFTDAPEWLTTLKNSVANQKSGEDLRRTISEITAKIPSVAKQVDAAVDATATAAKTANTASNTAKAAEVVSEELKIFTKLKEMIAAARKLGDSKELLKLLESPIIQSLAKQGNKAAQYLANVWRLVAPGAKWAGRALVVVGPLIDAYLIMLNRYELAAAKKTGNKELIQTLESKQTALMGGGTANLAILALSAPAAAVALPMTIGATIYTQGVYDSMATWQKSPEDWLSKPAKDLREKMEEYKMGKIDRGHRAAVGYSTAYSMWRWGTSWSKESKEKNQQEDIKQGEDVENINQNVRQELLLAYFMKTQLPPHEGETAELYKERVTPLLQDCMSYMKRFTNGSYDASLLGDHFFEQAKDYADLNAMRRSRQAQELRYQTENGEKSLDLTSLNYIGQGGDDAAKLKFMQTMHQYKTDVKAQKEAVEDLYRMDIPLA